MESKGDGKAVSLACCGGGSGSDEFGPAALAKREMTEADDRSGG